MLGREFSSEECYTREAREYQDRCVVRGDSCERVITSELWGSPIV